jgi:anoctamin-8
VDVDAIELNSLKAEFGGTLNYYMESVIDIGYITLFAAAFPVGPFILLLSNIQDVKMKILQFANVYRRPEAQRCAGIGEWVNIIELMSLVSVVLLCVYI